MDKTRPAPPHSPAAVTELLVSWGGGDESALARLMPVVHAELSRLARHAMRGERKSHTLQTTALVNEAYLRLVDLNGITFKDRSHFFAMSARLMRRILVDHARSRLYLKRGGGAPLVSFDEALTVGPEPTTNLIALDDALKVLADLDPRKSHVVELRFFGGLSVDETATALKVSEATVLRDWRLAKAWLLKQLSETASGV